MPATLLDPPNGANHIYNAQWCLYSCSVPNGACHSAQHRLWCQSRVRNSMVPTTLLLSANGASHVWLPRWWAAASAPPWCLPLSSALAMVPPTCGDLNGGQLPRHHPGACHRALLAQWCKPLLVPATCSEPPWFLPPCSHLPMVQATCDALNGGQLPRHHTWCLPLSSALAMVPPTCGDLNGGQLPRHHWHHMGGNHSAPLWCSMVPTTGHNCDVGGGVTPSLPSAGVASFSLSFFDLLELLRPLRLDLRNCLENSKKKISSRTSYTRS